MKKIISTLMCAAMIAGVSPVLGEESAASGESVTQQEERDVLANITDKNVKEIMKNTVMVLPGAENAFVYGKNVAFSQYLQGYEARKEDGKVYVPSEFLKDIFQGTDAGEKEESDIFEFAANNGLQAEEIDEVIYLCKKEYNLPKTIGKNLRKFFGIYVSPNSKGAGTKSKPCGSIESAKGIVQGVKESIGLPDGGIKIYLREGKYKFTKTMNFTSADSGLENSPITYTAYKDEKVAFDGGVTIKGSDFTKVTDADALKKIPDATNVVCYDLTKDLSGFDEGFRTMEPDNWTLSYGGEKLTVARWPDTDWARTGEILETPQNFRTEGFKFVVGETRIKKWKNEKNPKIMGYFGYDWAGERRFITSVDENLLAIKTNMGAEYGIAENKRYYAYNMLCELDSPGEYYFDTETNRLYFYPVEGFADNEEFLNGELQFALTSSTLVEMKDTDWVNFEKIIFENALGLAVSVDSKCENVGILGCTFTNIYAGVEFAGFNNTLKSCDFYNISNRPLLAQGGSRETLTPSNNLITNNKFWNFNTVARTNCGAINQSGCGDIISHNEFVGGPHTTIAFNGNKNIIEYNEFYDTMSDGASDAGTIYGGRNVTVQENTIRNNYFHNTNPSIGTVYFDDTLSNNYVEKNVFENTGRAVFIHGGIENDVKGNLSLNPVDSKVTFVSGTPATAEYWDSSTMGTLAGNNFLYHLNAFNWKSEPWTQYNYVFKYIDNWVNPFPMYETEITDNICVGFDGELLNFTEESVPYVTAENNTVLTSEEAKDYVVPEEYREIMENSGLYADEYRKDLSKLSGFELLRPYNKATEVEASNVRFEWSGAEEAYQYQFTLATDKEFKNIISNKYVKGTSVELNKLSYHNTRYYWKVKAIANDTNSLEGETEAQCSQGYYSFTTKAYEVVSREKLLERISICEGNMEGLAEGEEPGQLKPGTTERMKTLIASYKTKAESPTITNKEVTEYEETLKKEFEELTYNKNPEDYNFAAAVGQGSAWNFTPNQTIFAKDKLTLIYQSSQTLASADKLGTHVQYKFKFKWDGYDDGWVGIGIRAQSSPTAVPWSGNPMYFMIIKKDTVEFQKWGSGTNVNNSYTNEYTKNDEWAEFEILTEDRDDGTTVITWKVDGKTVVEYEDNDSPLRAPGYLYFYQGVKNAKIEIAPITE